MVERFGPMGIYVHFSEYDELQAENHTLRQQLAAARTAIAVKDKALEPFAAYTTADGIGPEGFMRIPGNHPILFNGLGNEAKAVVLVKHFRAARRALKSGGA